ncbi:DNRLRE domain-containing protein [Nocardiopsis terrae]
MRRSLARATAVGAACALALLLGGPALGTVGEEAPATPEDTAASGDPVGVQDRPAPTDEVTAGPTGPDGAPVDGSFVPAGSGGGRTEVENSLWTYVDRAFPDRPHSGTGTDTVGTGRLAWDRVYTRRALFRFPVALGSETVVDAAVLRAEVAWSYDCDSDSFVQLHRVDPFHTGTTWNDQPTARALLDTRNVRGGHAACPATGGVEFDVTEAYQRAVDNGEAHIHLRLGERNESGSSAWRRFDVRDNPPVLVVDHGPPRTPVPPPDPGGPPEAVSPGGHTAVHEEGTSAPAPHQAAEGGAHPVDAVPRGGGADGVRARESNSGARLPAGGEPDRSLRGERIGRPTPPDDRRRQAEDAVPRARGPPVTTP